jgi:hypothetical protein
MAVMDWMWEEIVRGVDDGRVMIRRLYKAITGVTGYLGVPFAINFSFAVFISIK